MIKNWSFGCGFFLMNKKLGTATEPTSKEEWPYREHKKKE
jgi:hypothetical protein